ncbi:hypothetical protein [Avibacterium paragallinarum]|nr:hypothetical protein [Avibacterium paragallinarum]WAL56422.1 hypothetical protein OY678_10735 [Avibacterium paragallinarum]
MNNEKHTLLVIAILYLLALLAFVGLPVAIVVWVIKWVWVS